MRRPPRSVPRTARVLGLCVSVAALAGMVHLEEVWARAEVEAAPADELDALELDEVEDVALDEARPPLLAMAPVAPPVAAKVEPAGPALVTMPDLTGVSVRSARKQLKELGLRLVARDEYRSPIPRELWSAYKVRDQSVEPGEAVLPGERVRVKAKSRRRIAEGY
ncbi:MAG: PASTA domain-containing protein [Myxococcales bacterium]|nr:PASTA domain-containing protein [Myxococcales bacterium]